MILLCNSFLIVNNHCGSDMICVYMPDPFAPSNSCDTLHLVDVLGTP